MSLHHVTHLALHGIKHAADKDGAEGALNGAAAVAGSVATAAAIAGLSLTPVGWVVFGTAGAVAGGTGLFKKLKEKLG